MRLRAAMGELATAKRKALVVYLTFGDPAIDLSVDAVCELARAGADVIELGVPYSDPNADGVVIQRAMERALGRGAGLASALAAVAEIRNRGCLVPIVLFGYYNPIFCYGVERFASDAHRAGVDAVLTVDLPAEELGELAEPLARTHVDVIPLVAPTSTPQRMAQVRVFHPPFVYAISMTGVTGTALRAGADLGAHIDAIRAATAAPVCIGFGIQSAADARRIAPVADGVVVGSAIVTALAERGLVDACSFVSELRAALTR